MTRFHSLLLTIISFSPSSSLPSSSSSAGQRLMDNASIGDMPDFDDWLTQIENGELDFSAPTTAGSHVHSLSPSSPQNLLHDISIFTDVDANVDHVLASIPPTHGVPMDDMPVELLIIVFTLCIADDPDIAPILSCVCRSWRAILLELPTLWQHLRLSDMRFNASMLAAKTNLWLSRTRHLPLDIDIDTRHRDSILPLLSYMLPAAHKWRSVSYLHSRMRFVTAKDGGDPRLEALLITLAPKKSLASDLIPSTAAEQSPTMRTWWGGRDLPQVKDFKNTDDRLREIYVLGIRSLPPPEQLSPFETVTSLVLMNASTECDFPMHQATSFLSAFPALESLELSNFNELFLIHDPEFRPDCRALAPAVLPYLRRLTVRGICSSRCVLSHIRAPALCYLALIHINSSGSFAHPLPEEPGDSDDEAHDFSRSPWTDHATGMGLRKLFSPSNDFVEVDGFPPLRELVMDYADLRTKDFIWLFQRLRHLEKFIIVASDLSDNVIRALSAPELSNANSDAASRSSLASVSDTDLDPTMIDVLEIPVPRLSRLKLSKCQKITGDAIVRMVHSRAIAAVRQPGLVSRFEEVMLSECMPVKESHHEALQQILPPETRLVYAPAFEED